jgi:hypothetical protein
MAEVTHDYEAWNQKITRKQKQKQNPWKKTKKNQSDQP